MRLYTNTAYQRWYLLKRAEARRKAKQVMPSPTKAVGILNFTTSSNSGVDYFYGF